MTKTVKDLNAKIDKLEDTVKRLQEMLETLIDTKITELEEREKESESKIEMLSKEIKRSVNINNDITKEIQCRVCGQILEKRLLKQHIGMTHPQSVKCSNCDRTFETRRDLEEHLKEHDIQKEFKCDQCASEFFLEWRLKRHLRGHTDINRKFCHYFNNGKVCPFEESGCKFKHEHSERCFYGLTCVNMLCQYQHDENKSIGDEEKLTTGTVDPNYTKVEMDKLKDELDKANETVNKLTDNLKIQATKLDTTEKWLKMTNDSKKTLESKLMKYSDSLRVFIKEKEKSELRK